MSINDKKLDSFTQLDVYSFKEKGLSKWYKSKKPWPLDSHQIYKVQEEVRLVYDSWIKKLPDSISKPLIVLYKLKIKIEHLILMQIAIEESSKKPIIYSNESLLHILINKGSARKEDLSSYINKGLYANVDFKTIVKQRLKTFINKIRFFEFNFNLLSKSSNDYYSIINYPHEDLIVYTKNQNKNFHFIYPYLLFFKKKKQLIIIKTKNFFLN